MRWLRLLALVAFVVSLIVPVIPTGIVAAQVAPPGYYYVTFEVAWQGYEDRAGVWFGMGTEKGEILTEEQDAGGTTLGIFTQPMPPVKNPPTNSMQVTTRKVVAKFAGDYAGEVTSKWSPECGLVTFFLDRWDAWTRVQVYSLRPLYKKGGPPGSIEGQPSGTITLHTSSASPACASFTWSLPIREARPEIWRADSGRGLNEIGGQSFLQDGIGENETVVIFQSQFTRRIITREEVIQRDRDWTGSYIWLPNDVLDDIKFAQGELFVRVGKHESKHIPVTIVNGRFY